MKTKWIVLSGILVPVLMAAGWLCLWVLPTLMVSGIEVRESLNDNEASPSPTAAAASDALTATELADNGMAVGEAPEIIPSGTVETAVFDVETVQPQVDAVFPENHKNFSSSIEPPPFLQDFNKYQQQYKEYYAQKNQYTSLKPVRFEDNQSSGLSAYGDDTQSGSETEQRHRPFPYLFDHGQQSVESEPQTAYPIPEGNLLLETSTESSSIPGMFGFPSGFPLGALFGSGKVKHQEGHRSELSKPSHGSSWKKILKVISTVIPFGLFLATLTPNILFINSTEDTRPSRLRSMDDQTESMKIVDPLVELVERFGGLEAMEDPICEDRFFCEMSVLGQKDESNFIEKGFWYLANQTPDDIAEQVGMRDLFKAVRTNACETYNCRPKKNTTVPEKEFKQQEKTEKELKYQNNVIVSEKGLQNPKENKIRKHKKFIRT